ncbi:MAG: cbb3-type cytochrome c oxidase subunit I [Verrucomicrobiota bacterium]
MRQNISQPLDQNDLQKISSSKAHEDQLQRQLIDTRCRNIVTAFFSASLVWLLSGSALAIAASIKLHSPDFLTQSDWLTFGRVRPAHLNTMAYGWVSGASIGVGLWIMSRLTRVPLSKSPWLWAAFFLWNIGITVGTIGILRGDSTSIEWLEFPGYTAPFLLGAFAIAMFEIIRMMNKRPPGHVYISQWYILAAFCWFPWLYATAVILLVWFPVQAPAMPPINWWFAHNALGLWFTPVSLAAAYYLIPKVVGKPIHSYYLSMIGFWSLGFFYAWNGMHHLIGGPFPAWLISASIAASIMMLVPVITVAINHHMTMKGSFHYLKSSPTLRFVVFAAVSYTLVSVQGSSAAIRPLNQITHFTHYTIGHAHLGMYAFVTMMLFGAMYYIMPRLWNREWPSAFLIRSHFWLCALGVALMTFALSIGGWIQGWELNKAEKGFMEILEITLPYLQARSLSGGILTLAHLMFTLSFLLLIFGWSPRGGTPTLLEANTPFRRTQ